MLVTASTAAAEGTRAGTGVQQRSPSRSRQALDAEQDDQFAVLDFETTGLHPLRLDRD
jgi:DNA polymerase III epsilon subunit-like protein